MVSELQETNNTATKEKYQHDQIQDRLRHYEAQAQVVEALQRELHNSQVSNLSNTYYNNRAIAALTVPTVTIAALTIATITIATDQTQDKLRHYEAQAQVVIEVVILSTCTFKE